MSASGAPVGEKKSVPFNGEGRVAALTSSAAGSRTATDLEDEHDGQDEHDGMPLPVSHDESEDRLNELDALEDDSFPNPFTSPIQCPKKLFSIIDEYFFNYVVNIFLPDEETESRKNLRFAAQKFGQFLGVIAGAGSIFVSVLFAPFIFFGALPIKDTKKAFTFALATSVLLGIAFVAAPYALPAVLTWLFNYLSSLGIGSFFSNVIVPTWGPQLSLLTGTTFGLTTLGSPATTIGAAIVGAGFLPYVFPLAVAFFTLKCFLMPVANEFLLPLAKQAYAYIRGLCGCKDDHAKDKITSEKTIAVSKTRRPESVLGQAMQRAQNTPKATSGLTVSMDQIKLFNGERYITLPDPDSGDETIIEGKICKTQNKGHCFVSFDGNYRIPINSDAGLGLSSDRSLRSRSLRPTHRDQHVDADHRGRRSHFSSGSHPATLNVGPSVPAARDKAKISSETNPLLRPPQPLSAAPPQSPMARTVKKPDSKDEKDGKPADKSSGAAVHTALSSSPPRPALPAFADPKEKERAQVAPAASADAKEKERVQAAAPAASASVAANGNGGGKGNRRKR
jgi:hypothetical protein